MTTSRGCPRCRSRLRGPGRAAHLGSARRPRRCSPRSGVGITGRDRCRV